MINEKPSAYLSALDSIQSEFKSGIERDHHAGMISTCKWLQKRVQ